MLPNLTALSTGTILPCEQPRYDVFESDSGTLRGLQLKETVADGSCLFHALHALSKNPTIFKEAFAETPQDSSIDLKRRLYEFINTHFKIFAKMIDEERLKRFPDETDESYVRRYGQMMMHVDVFEDGTVVVENGGETEIQAFAMIYNVIVYTIDGDDFTHILSRNFPCSYGYTVLTTEEAHKLSTVVLVYDKFMKHYSSVRARGSGASTSASDVDPAAQGPPDMTASERHKYNAKRARKKEPTPNMNWELRKLAMEREARNRARIAENARRLNPACSRDPSADMTPETAEAIRQMVERDEQSVRDHELALALLRMNLENLENLE